MKIQTIFVVLFFFSILFFQLDVSALTPEENKAYNEGQKAIVPTTYADCGYPGTFDYENNNSPRADEFAYKSLAKFTNPYSNEPGLHQAWEDGFLSQCVSHYEGNYYLGSLDAAYKTVTSEECKYYGEEDGKNGKPSRPAGLSRELASKSPHLPTNEHAKQRFFETVDIVCSKNYERGYKIGYQEYKQQQDLGVVKEIGEQFGIEEKDVVEFFGGGE